MVQIPSRPHAASIQSGFPYLTTEIATVPSPPGCKFEGQSAVEGLRLLPFLLGRQRGTAPAICQS
ncbi:MAG: hypothetical protein KatS3mg112_1281 [Thermogutta sp.]|nr:MAG: hypothetical protein KatS3mg112_1281 [Thermogutta sp.]